MTKKCRYDILRMIGAAGSGHVGGSLSTVDMLAYLRCRMGEQDRLVISHGHCAAAVYAVLGNLGYCDVEEAVASFRRRPPYEGHPSIAVNGVEWCSGALGQGLSVGCGFAMAKKLRKEAGTVYVLMGDGEQQKGQLQEAREFAVRHGLDNLVAVVDYNGLQASGRITDVGADGIADKYAASGWCVRPLDGHDMDAMEQALADITAPTCLIATTVMGKGVPEIEGDYAYHGTPVSQEVRERSLARLALTPEETALLAGPSPAAPIPAYTYPAVSYTPSAPYAVGDSVDVRSGLGHALAALAAAYPAVPMAALDCDLEGSVKLGGFRAARPDGFVECGIAEQNAVTVAAAMARSGVIAFQADFSVFNLAETYSQNRMAAINKAPLKWLSTHAGLDVGEDGKTHQCIDYLSLLSNLYGVQVIVPADANQGAAAVRYAASVAHPVAVVAGRSKLPVLGDEEGRPLGFTYGKAQWLRRGADGTILTYGNMVHRALQAADILREQGVAVGVLNAPTPLVTDTEALDEAARTGLVVTYEDHNLHSGIAGLIARHLLDSGIPCRLLTKGVTHFGASAAPDRLYAEQGLDPQSVANDILHVIKPETVKI